MKQSGTLMAGEWVQVRSKEEILCTLDRKGRLEQLPFMPQMLQYCGQTVQVRKRAHKLCDTAQATGGRSLTNSVFLEGMHCDGRDFGGCEMRCELFWKEAWLKPLDREAVETAAGAPAGGQGCTEADIVAAIHVPGEEPGTGEPVYSCQATQMIHATRSLPRWEIAQYLEDHSSGNTRWPQIIAGIVYVVYSGLVDSGLGFGTILRWLYDAFQRLRGATPYPGRRGRLPLKSRTPSARLNLQVGEWARVKSYEEILATVDETLINRGMAFHPEMVPYCGRVFRVRQRLRKLMNEKTGRLMELKNECLVLEGADCIGRYTKPLNCPRGMPPYWREIWLERAEPPVGATVEPGPAERAQR